MLKIGDVNTLTVKRKTDIGYVLTDGTEEIFLHNNETNHQILSPNDKVEAFLYYDFKARLAATLSSPLITVSEAGFVVVKDVLHELGVFVDNHTSKDILVSKDFLPYDLTLWPEKGDLLLCILKHKNRLVAKPLNKVEITLEPATKLYFQQRVEAFVIHTGKEGLNLITKEGHLIFVHHTQMRTPHRLGEKLNVRISRVNPTDYAGSLLENKEITMDKDAQVIYQYMELNGNKMPLNSDSDVAIIESIFKMSKKAFKRALGRLYSEHKIIFTETGTEIVKGENNGK